MPNAPKLWLLQWTDTKNTPQTAVFATKALAIAYVTDEDIVQNTPFGKGVFLYRLGDRAAIREWNGTWD
jgi:hypothetical protein